MKINHLTAAEENLMTLLWKLNSFYLKDIMEHHPEPKPHQNTISTYVKILTEKGYLSIEKQGRIFKYSVALPSNEYKRFLIKQLCCHFFNDSETEMLEFLLNENIISPENLTPDFDFKPELHAEKVKQPKFEYANEVLNPKKEKKKKKKKKKI